MGRSVGIKQIYSGAQLTRFRALMFATLGDTCHLCGESGADTLDHVIPRSIRPDLAFDPNNVLPAHRKCNSARGTRPLEELKEASGW